MTQLLKIGTRTSKLAMWQTDHIIDRLQKAWPGLECRVEPFMTQGDQILDKPLPQIGGKGLFTAELEAALRDGRIDIAVHSLKDLPVDDEPGLTLGAITSRAPVGDALIAREGWTLETLPQRAIIGTSSNRRRELLSDRLALNTVPSSFARAPMRKLRKLNFCGILAVLFGGAGTWNFVGAQPNVILILADDLGYGDLSILGQKRFQTPNIDRLGKEGVVFTQHYSGNTVCSPSRASLMTGQHPGHVHCRANSGETMAALDPTMTTLPRLFKNAGYATGAFGKWGLGETSSEGKQNPLTHGFDQFTGWKSQGIAHTYYPSTIVRNGKEAPLAKGT